MPASPSSPTSSSSTEDSADRLRLEIEGLAQAACQASAIMGEMPAERKNAWLLRSAERLEEAKGRIMAANAEDVETAAKRGISGPLRGRLSISEGKWADMLQGLRDVVALPDPVGRITNHSVRPNGLRVAQMAIPLGVIAMIYESRPNVTVDAAALCVKAGNSVILRGGSEAIHSNLVLGDVLRAAALEEGIPEDAITIIPTTDRAAIDVMLKLNEWIDLVIPRGGAGLVHKVIAESTIPVIAHDAGVCHIFIDESADTRMAVDIVLESKIRQMPVCNAVETLLCHRDASKTVLPNVLKSLHEAGVEIRGCDETRAIDNEAIAATEADWSEEFLSPTLAVRIVGSMDDAIEHIRTFGSNHTEIIVTNDYANSQNWLRRVNSSTVGVNCATGFSDGFELGLGAEIGISTSKLHAYGPMGLEGLTTRKFILVGEGQLRG
ncbi:MAG: glutamate-5-semialdehyde dehydrogenase [Myxococcales bacterium]|nr:glutamate-5-semialdehyde dehydrogenase [Myxococcales bacterium]HIK86560.1 glutamate-5-semialdehyde dehydrogenase [Myxococcales bacterium]